MPPKTQKKPTKPRTQKKQLPPALVEWNNFVKQVRAKYPELSFKEALMKAKQLKDQYS